MRHSVKTTEEKAGEVSAESYEALPLSQLELDGSGQHGLRTYAIQFEVNARILQGDQLEGNARISHGLSNIFLTAAQDLSPEPVLKYINGSDVDCREIADQLACVYLTALKYQQDCPDLARRAEDILCRMEYQISTPPSKKIISEIGTQIEKILASGGSPMPVVYDALAKFGTTESLTILTSIARGRADVQGGLIEHLTKDPVEKLKNAGILSGPVAMILVSATGTFDLISLELACLTATFVVAPTIQYMSQLSKINDEPSSVRLIEGLRAVRALGKSSNLKQVQKGAAMILNDMQASAAVRSEAEGLLGSKSSN